MSTLIGVIKTAVGTLKPINEGKIVGLYPRGGGGVDPGSLVHCARMLTTWPLSLINCHSFAVSMQVLTGIKITVDKH